jgi:hypothetical protein
MIGMDSILIKTFWTGFTGLSGFLPFYHSVAG